MYRAFFQLQDNPFSLTPDPDYLYLQASHREALDHLDYGVRERKGFIEIIGAPGTGKTTLCRLILDRDGHEDPHRLHLQHLPVGRRTARAILRRVRGATRGRGAQGAVDALNRFLIDVAAEGGNAVLLIDEAQNLSQPALEQLADALQPGDGHREAPPDRARGAA